MTRTLHLIPVDNGRTVRLTEDDGGLRLSIDSPGMQAASARITAGDLAALAASAEDYREVDLLPLPAPPATPPGADLND